MLLAFCSTALGQLDRILEPVVLPAKPVKAEAAIVAAPAPEQVKESNTRLFTADNLAEELRKLLVEHYTLSGDFKITLTRSWEPLKLPVEDISVAILDYPADGLASLFYVRCKVLSMGQTVGEWQIGLRAQLWQDAWVASSRLDRGQALDSSLVVSQKVDVLRNREPFLSANVDLSTCEVAQSVPAGRPLTKRDVVERPLVRKNQVVEVVAQRGMMSMTMKALALEDGGAKALIKMRNLDSRKEFVAQVINENSVQVHF